MVGAQHLFRLKADPRPLAAQARHQRGVVGLARFGELDPQLHGQHQSAGTGSGYNGPMSVLSSDTHPKMEALQIQLWRQSSPTRKMQMLAQLNSSARTLALTGLRSRYPQASEAELRRRLAGLLLGEELAGKLYGETSHAK